MVKVMLLIDTGQVEQTESILADAIQLVELHKDMFHPQLARIIAILDEHTQRSGKQDLYNELKRQTREIIEATNNRKFF